MPTLSQWLANRNEVPIPCKDGRTLFIPTDNDLTSYRGLYMLEDYAVTSNAGGAICLRKLVD